jgi:hypothetical protein
MKITNLIITLLLIIAVNSLQAKPSLARMTNIQVDSSGNLLPPDLYHFENGLRFYRKGDKGIGLQRFLFAAEFGNKKAVKFVGLMYLEGDGVDKQRLKGIAWIKMSADNGDNESIQLTKQFNNLLSADENAEVEIIYQGLKEVYGRSAVLNNIYKFKRRFNFQTLQKPNTIKFQKQNITLNSLQIQRLESQTQKYYNAYKRNMGKVTLGDIIIKKD